MQENSAKNFLLFAYIFENPIFSDFYADFCRIFTKTALK